MKRLTTSEFIEKARHAHGDTYDYSKVEYVNNSVKVCIICPIHGEFWQAPRDHLSKHGCPRCNVSQKSKKVLGVGVNDVANATIVSYISYSLWLDILKRCYSERRLKRFPTYIGCSISEEWKLFSEFRKWFDSHYIEGWSLDKDILVKGNKVYGPKTCCFVPNEINTFFTKRQNDRGKFVIGVVNKRNNKYISSISINGHIKHLGCFETEEEAFDAYKEAKEEQAKKLADKYKTQLDPRVYEALYNYNVAITD